MFTKYGYEFETNHYVSSGGVQDTEFGYAGNDYWVGSPGTDIFFGGDGFDFVDHFASPMPVNVDLAAAMGSGAHGFAQGDRYFSIEGFAGSRFDDTFWGYAEWKGGVKGVDLVVSFTGGVAEVFFGLDGNDLARGFGGDDTLDGGEGNDTLRGDEGNDVLLGGNGDDLLMGNDDDDSLAGGDGDDTIEGGAGDDTIGGGAGQDMAEGGAGNDTLRGGAGADTL